MFQIVRAMGWTAMLGLLIALPVRAEEPALTAQDYRADALSFEPGVNDRYAYLERFGGHFALTPKVEGEAQAVHDSASLLTFLERAIALLADHHAITGSSFANSWALVPSFSDLWIEQVGDRYLVTGVRSHSPAEGVVMPGDELTAVGGVQIGEAITAFWSDLGLEAPDAEHRAYAARVLLAGRRDRERNMTFERAGTSVPVTLPSLYAVQQRDRPPLAIARVGDAWHIRFNDSLGDSATIAAFDEAMAAIPDEAPLVLDLTDTASGGNSSIARAIIGWFITQPRPYQVHESPEEQRATGIPRMWVEYVVPRVGKHHSGPVSVRVDRWTGSMGEGLAVGLDAMGAPVCGSPMAGLRGAVEDIALEHSGQIVKLPTERLSTTAHVPRERFVPHALDDPACATNSAGG